MRALVIGYLAIALLIAGFFIGYLYGVTSSCGDSEVWSWQSRMCVEDCPAVGCV
jgi:hypothetical protein